MSVSEILSRSSNVGAITLAERLTRHRLVRWISRFGFGHTTGIDFPAGDYIGGDGQTMTMRTVQTGNGEGHSRTSSARQPDGSWREMWTMRFTRAGPAPPR